MAEKNSAETNGATRVGISKNKLTPGGLKKTFHGNLYQWSLLTWVTLQASSSSRRFELITEAEEYGKFDDLVIKYDNEMLLLQAKHSSKEDGTDDYKKSDFTTNNHKGDASLSKYFDSWYWLKNNLVRNKKFIFFTNRGVADYSSFLEPVTVDIPQLAFEKGETLRFKSGDSRSDFINAIKDYYEKVEPSKKKKKAFSKSQKIKDMEKEINEFLDHLILKVKQPNFPELSKIICKKSKNPIAAAEVCVNIEKRVLRWFADPKDCDLSSDEILQMILSAEGDALRFYLLASTNQQHSLPGTSLKEIADFLKSDNLIIKIKKFEGIDLRMAQTIKEFGISEDQYAFLHEASPYLEYVSTILHGEQMQVVVFDFSNYEQSQVEMLQNLMNRAFINKKKVVLICETNDENFKKYGQQIDVDSELSDKQIQRAVEGKQNANINIAGKNFKLEKFLADKTSGVYKAMKHTRFLYEILYQNNQKNLSSGLLHNIYVPNKLLKGEPIFNWCNLLSTVQTCLFVVKGPNAKDVQSAAENGEGDFKERTLFNHEQVKEDSKYRVVRKEDLTLVSEAESHIRQICIDATVTSEIIPYNNYVVLNVIENDKATIEAFKGVLLPIAENYNFDNEVIVTREDVIAKNFCVISAKAGYGKSSFCRHQRMQWLNSEQKQYSWVIRLDLSCLQFKSENASEKELFNEKTSSVCWSDWQLKALKNDMQQPGRVRILLDGFDEIKDSTVIKKLGDWMGNLPKEVNLLITTRPYAAHIIPMPANRSLDFFLSLQEYNESYRNQYIKAYISAIVENPIHEHLETLIKPYEEFAISYLNVKSLIGVPLEMYLFCETFEFEILERYEELIKGEKPSKKIAGFQLSAVSLIEKFMIKKLSIFLTKHLRIENQLRSIKDEHLAFVTSSLYIDLLQAFAFKQAFNLKYEVVARALRDRYCNDNLIQELKETGLVLVERKHNEYFLKFNHETYQEYFSGLKLISGLISGDSDVQEIYYESKLYMPRYQVIFEFAGELSLSRSRLLSRLNQDQLSGARKFWRTLFDDTPSVGLDLFGAALYTVRQRCLSALSENSRATFERFLCNKDSITLMYQLGLFDYKEKQFVPGQQPVVEQIKKVCNDSNNLKMFYNENEVKNCMKSYCNNKNNLKKLKEYIKSFSKEEQGMVRKALSNELVDRKEWDENWNYWAIDFGISAVALCGEYFSKGLADKLKCRADMWQNNFTPALRIWDKVVGTVWSGHSEDLADVISYGLSQLLQSEYSRFYLNEELPNLRKIVGAFLEYLKSNFDYGKSITEILQIAEKLNYAVVVNEDNTVLQLIGDEKYSLSIKHPFFFETLKILKTKKCVYPSRTMDIDLIRSDHMLKELDNKYKLERLAKLNSV